MIMFAKFEMATCILGKKMDIQKCNENPTKVLSEAKVQFGKDMKSLWLMNKQCIHSA